MWAISKCCLVLVTELQRRPPSRTACSLSLCDQRIFMCATFDYVNVLQALDRAEPACSDINQDLQKLLITLVSHKMKLLRQTILVTETGQMMDRQHPSKRLSGSAGRALRSCEKARFFQRLWGVSNLILQPPGPLSGLHRCPSATRGCPARIQSGQTGLPPGRPRSAVAFASSCHPQQPDPDELASSEVFAGRGSEGPGKLLDVG